MNSLHNETLLFWNLQLQLFQLDSYSLINMFYNVRSSDIYISNKHTKSLDSKYLYNTVNYSSLTEDDMKCLATHIALQFGGIYE